ncbi:MAG: response regulator, partial [Proteobacteria bacterium]|nr:response regulator [Pseudomonadota bacterium]
MTPGEIMVLVVDDVNAMRVQIRDILKDIGFQKVTVASNGEEAKKAMEDQTFQLILA